MLIPSSCTRGWAHPGAWLQSITQQHPTSSAKRQEPGNHNGAHKNLEQSQWMKGQPSLYTCAQNESICEPSPTIKRRC